MKYFKTKQLYRDIIRSRALQQNKLNFIPRLHVFEAAFMNKYFPFINWEIMIEFILYSINTQFIINLFPKMTEISEVGTPKSDKKKFFIKRKCMREEQP